MGWLCLVALALGQPHVPPVHAALHAAMAADAEADFICHAAPNPDPAPDHAALDDHCLLCQVTAGALLVPSPVGEIAPPQPLPLDRLVQAAEAPAHVATATPLQPRAPPIG